jgi:hypothetical protein
MRTTVNISDHLLIEAKKLAASKRRSLASVIEDSLRKYLAEARASKGDKQISFELPVMKSGKVAKGVTLDDTSLLLDL